MLVIDLARHMTVTDPARRMIHLTDHGMGSPVVHPVQIVIHMRRNGAVDHILGHLDVLETTTTDISLAIVLPDIMGIRVITARAPRILEKVIDHTRGTLERVANPIYHLVLAPILLNTGRGLVMPVICVNDPVPELLNTTISISLVVAGLSGLVLQVLSIREGIIAQRVPATLAIPTVHQRDIARNLRMMTAMDVLPHHAPAILVRSRRSSRPGDRRLLFLSQSMSMSLSMVLCISRLRRNQPMSIQPVRIQRQTHEVRC